MSCQHFIWAMDRGRELKLPPSERLLLLAMADRANSAGYFWPSRTTMAGDTGLSVRSCHTLSHSLEGRGLIAMEQRGRSMVYRVQMPPKDYEPVQPLHGSASQEGAEHYQPVQPLHRSKPAAAPTSATIASKPPSIGATIALKPTKYEPTKTKSVGFYSNLSKEAGTPPAEPEREPTPREIEAKRREEAAAIAGMPEGIARAVQSLGAAIRGIEYAPGRSGISRDEQLATYEPRRPKAAYANPEQLRAIRLLAARSLGRSPLAPGLSLVSR